MQLYIVYLKELKEPFHDYPSIVVQLVEVDLGLVSNGILFKKTN